MVRVNKSLIALLNITFSITAPRNSELNCVLDFASIIELYNVYNRNMALCAVFRHQTWLFAVQYEIALNTNPPVADVARPCCCQAMLLPVEHVAR